MSSWSKLLSWIYLHLRIYTSTACLVRFSGFTDLMSTTCGTFPCCISPCADNNWKLTQNLNFRNFSYFCQSQTGIDCASDPYIWRNSDKPIRYFCVHPANYCKLRHNRVTVILDFRKHWLQPKTCTTSWVLVGPFSQLQRCWYRPTRFFWSQQSTWSMQLRSLPWPSKRMRFPVDLSTSSSSSKLLAITLGNVQSFAVQCTRSCRSKLWQIKSKRPDHGFSPKDGSL